MERAASLEVGMMSSNTFILDFICRIEINIALSQMRSSFFCLPPSTLSNESLGLMGGCFLGTGSRRFKSMMNRLTAPVKILSERITSRKNNFFHFEIMNAQNSKAILCNTESEDPVLHTSINVGR